MDNIKKSMDKYKCNICNKLYSSYKSLWNHNKDFHNNINKNVAKCQPNVNLCQPNVNLCQPNVNLCQSKIIKNK